jgi:DNA mismatch repair protein MutL
LLISEPFKISKGKIDNHFEDLKNLGFELDRLNSEVIALRTLPRFVPQALSRDITNTLINFFDQAKNREYSLDQVNLFLEANYPKVFSIPEHLIVLIVERLHQAKGSSLVLLSEKNVKGLLK